MSHDSHKKESWRTCINASWFTNMNQSWRTYTNEPWHTWVMCQGFMVVAYERVVFLGKTVFKRHLFYVPLWDKMRSNTKIWNRIVYFWLQCDGKEAELQRHSLPIAQTKATESGASWLAERAPMMPFGLCMCRATWCQPCAAADGAPQENPVSNTGPSIRHDKKDIVGKRGLLKTALPMSLDPRTSRTGYWRRNFGEFWVEHKDS